MTERLILVGGGGFGRELIGHALDLHRAGHSPEVSGYLDDGGANVLASLGYELPWLGPIADYAPGRGDRLLLGIGTPDGKRKVVEMLLARGASFTRLLHPTALITARTRIGEGTIFGPFTGSGTETRIGDYVTVNSYSGFGHDSSAGDFTTISAHVDIMGYAQLGCDVFVGSNASILPKVRIGNNAKIGAGATVYRSVPAGATAYAPAAKLLKR
jgi:sugar O-acyltransferase (sialic acid O-acetyltransferase NeuD family)